MKPTNGKNQTRDSASGEAMQAGDNGAASGAGATLPLMPDKHLCTPEKPAIWTQRMLEALHNGVKGGKWFSLMDKVYSMRTLTAAWDKVRANRGAPGVDHITVKRFEYRVSERLEQLSVELRSGRYRPQPVKRVMIPKPGSCEKRPLGIPTVRDRIVQAAIKMVIEPIFEHEFAKQSYGFRPGRGCLDALRRTEQLLKSGHTWVVDADIKSYFDTIPHEALMKRLETRVADGKLLELIGRLLKQGIMEGLASWTPEEGTPQGAVLSPLLSNIYLDPLDHLMEHKGFEMVRYADDFVVLCTSEEQARQALAQIEQWMSSNGLILHPTKTRLVDARQQGGFDFLGYHFERNMKWPRSKSMKKLKAKLRPITKRNNGHCLNRIISEVNLSLRGWFNYFRYSKRTTFTGLDGWVRGRLRSILRKRLKLRGRARGKDHQRWPNAFFVKAGLFSTLTAHERFLRSS